VDPPPGAGVARQAAVVQAAGFAAEASGVPFEAALARARTLSGGRQAPVLVEATTIGGREDALPSGFDYTAPGNLVLTSIGLRTPLTCENATG
jgi:hypothetical protein